MSSSVLDAVWNSAQPKLSEIRASLAKGKHENPRIIRVGQLDSELLDQELAQLLKEPINKALSLISSNLKARFEPELGLLIQLTLYKLSVWNIGASYGAKLQDLRFVTSNRSSGPLAPSGLPRNTLIMHGALTLLLPYCHNRLRLHALSNAWPDAPSADNRRKAWDALNSVESIHALLGLANFIVFLWNGRYRTMADRLLKMNLVPSRRQVMRDVSYEFMNRQMVWHAFTEFLLFLLPLISPKTIRRRLYRIASSFSPTLFYALLPFNKTSDSRLIKTVGSVQQRRGKFWALPDDQCAICAENATFNLDLSEPANLFTNVTVESDGLNLSDQSSYTDDPKYPIYTPYQTSCGHIYCYSCIAERIMRTADESDDDQRWACLRCGEKVTEAHRYTVEIGESERGGSEYEFSSDFDLGTDLSESIGSYSESGLSE